MSFHPLSHHRGLLLATLVTLSPIAAAQVDSTRGNGNEGSRVREESWQIEQRQRWFIESRGLDRVLDPSLQRRAAAAELMAQVERFAPLQRAAGETWTALGPSSMTMGSWAMGRVSGRNNAVVPHPTDDNIVYFGAAAGGVWKTTDGGGSWTPLFDQVGTQPIGALFIEPAAPANVWVGTGDRNGGACAGYFGQGVYLSSDGGTSWQARNGSGAGLMPLSVVNAVTVQPTDANVVLAGGAGSCSASGTLSGSGAYRSADRGASWTKVLNGNVEDILFVPGTATAYAAVAGGGVYKSTNGGATWNLSSTGITVSGSRLRLAMSASNTSVMYVLMGAQLYRSADGGANWSLRSSSACEGQCGYNQAIDVHPTQPDTLLIGSIRAARSTNGGTTLTYLTTTWGSSQTVHQDTHVVRYSRSNPDRFWIGSDGGVWRTENSGSSWVNMNSNLNVTQFYDIAVHPTNSDIVFGGAQDNSSLGRSNSPVWALTFVSGDGFMNAVDPATPSIVFQTSYPSGGFPSIYRSTSSGGANTFSKLSTTGMTSSSSFPWVTPMAVASGRIFVASNVIYRGTTSANPFSWTAISGALGSSVSVLTPATIGTMTPTYAGTSGGRIYASADAAVPSPSWTDVTGNYPGGVVSDIAMDPLNAQRVFATRAGFGASRLYRSTSGGTSWSAVGNGLPNVPANTVAIDPQNTNRVFVGTDVGVYESSDGGDNFIAFSTGLPLGLVVTDLEVDNSPHVLTAGTFGRGAWKVTLNSGGNQAPVANFSSATSGLTATFTDSSTDSDGIIASRSWNFGDGTTSTATNPSKAYTAAGTYTVTLTVTDNAGATNTRTASVTVSSGGGAQTYTNTTDFTISDNSTVDSPIIVSGRTGNAPSNASVTVAIVHTYQGDLKVDLVAPDGTLYNIHNRTGAGTDNINKTVTLDLSSELLNGTWNLRVNDNAGGDVGRIDSWSITF